MKYKVGTDIEEIARIGDLLKKGDVFLKRCFTENEISYIENKGKAEESAAGMFCAKEAFSKALGTGFSNFGFRDIEILHDDKGKPYIHPVGRLAYMSSSDFELSISHSGNYATATVISSVVYTGLNKREYIMSSGQMKTADKLTHERIVPSVKLMENAARALLSEFGTVKGKKAVILCGSGNNGGDGVCLASMLFEKGCFVSVIFSDNKPLSVDSQYYFDRLKEGIDVLFYSSINESRIREVISEADFAADCIFGTGFSGNLPENAKKLLSYIKCFTVACDVPSGVRSDDGSISEGVHVADVTVTFGAAKPCHYLYPAKDFCGKIIVADIGIPNDIIEEAGFEAEIITESTVKDFVPSRPENSNKGTFGTLCLSCGSENMPGAALLALKAALVSGVGLCTVESTENVKKLLQSQVPEAIYPSSSGRETAVLVGCGLTKNKEEVRRQLEKNLPTLLDADALNVLADDISLLCLNDSPKILTPHPLEMARLIRKTVSDVESNRFGIARNFAEKYQCVLLLKGHHTVIASPDGRLWVSKSGNSGLAKGGSGDVLSGFIAGLLASGFSAEGAAVCGVFCQGRASEFLTEKKGLRGYTPSDVASIIGRFIPECI